jgi:hypothetical protein
VTAVAVGRVARRDGHRLALGHAPDLALEDAQLRQVDQVVGEVDRQQRRGEPLQVRRGVVVARGLDLVQQMGARGNP